MNKQRGFTLIELLVVIAIIGILSSVVLTALNNARVKARIASVQSTMHSIQSAAITCMDDNSPLGTPTVGQKICPAATATVVWPPLPSTGSWTYSVPTPGPDSNGDFLFRATAASSGDNKVISCTLSGCVTS